MTPERQNEIWAMLDAKAKKIVNEMYVNAEIAFNQGHTAYGMRLSTLEELFGKHNLTAQAQERLLFKSEYKAGDKVVITGSLCSSKGKAITLVKQYDCPREANDYQKLWVGQFEDGHTYSIAERDFTPTVEFEQAEEKPKEPKFKVGDKVIVNGKFIAEIYDIDSKVCPEFPYRIKKSEGYYGFFTESELEPYTPASKDASKDADIDASQDAKISKENGQNPLKVAENGNLSTNEDAYFAYRLDLAKEIAVAVIKSDRWDFNSCNPVDVANDIVEQLKETEE